MSLAENSKSAQYPIRVYCILTSAASYKGYVPSEQGGGPGRKLAGWSVPEDSDNGPIDPSGYGTADIICHDSATPAKVSAQVEAGSTVDLVCMVSSWMNRWRTAKEPRDSRRLSMATTGLAIRSSERSFGRLCSIKERMYLSAFVALEYSPESHLPHFSQIHLP